MWDWLIFPLTTSTATWGKVSALLWLVEVLSRASQISVWNCTIITEYWIRKYAINPIWRQQQPKVKCMKKINTKISILLLFQQIENYAHINIFFWTNDRNFKAFKCHWLFFLFFFYNQMNMEKSHWWIKSKANKNYKSKYLISWKYSFGKNIF